METTLLKMKNIHKSFLGVKALQGVDLTVNAGEVLALVGENGAGKSTLIKVLGGIYQRDQGDIEILGKAVNIKAVNEARALGISIIHQELVLVPELSVAENIFLNREPVKRKLVDFERLYAEAQSFLDDLGVKIDAKSCVSELSIAQQQMVEVAKAISFQARIICMDEPTSSLSDREIDSLFEKIRLLKAKKIGILYISHRLSELNCIADRVLVLRDGKTAGCFDAKKISNEEIVNLMVGRELHNYYTRTFHCSNEIILSVKNLTSQKVKNISFDLRKGEILGFAGLMGAGRTEIVRTLLGFDKVLSGHIIYRGKRVLFKGPSQAYLSGIAYIPENRREESIFPTQSVRFNFSLQILSQFIKGIYINRRKEKIFATEFMKKLKIVAASQETAIQYLSGGNQQKVIIARWLAAKPSLLILDEPTRGIDVGAKAEIYEFMNSMVAHGISIIMISSELPEIINMSDRVVVVRDGMISKILGRSEISQPMIMRYAVNV